MTIGINTNVEALNVKNNISQTQSELFTSMQRLSTGLRINSASDDSAGLAISTRMTAQIQGMNQAVRNSNDGVSVMEVAESGLQTINDALLRIREIAVQSINDTNTANDRDALQLEVNQLLTEINKTIDRTEFNETKLFDGNYIAKQYQVGANFGDVMEVTIPGVKLSEVGTYQIATINTRQNQGAGSVLAPVVAVTPDSANSIAAQTVTFAGTFGSTLLSIAANATAEEIAEQFNNIRNSTNVRASAETEVQLDNLSTDGTITFNLANNDMGSFIQVSAAVSISDLSPLIQEINNNSGATGITAKVGGTNSELILTQSEGKNIVISNFNHTTNGATIEATGADNNTDTITDGFNDSTVVAGVVTLKSDSPFSAQSSEDDTTGSLFDVAAGAETLSTLESLDGIDVSTQESAENALDILDAVINTVNSIRGSIGSYQKRFELIIGNVTTQAENLTSARSRIQDADFAVEATNLARSQILLQAGVAVLAQANAIPQTALTLLQ